MAAGVPSEQRMANQIAANLRHQPADVAAETLATHIRRFWDPRMRARLFELVDAGGDGLDPLVAEGVRRLRKDEQQRVG